MPLRRSTRTLTAILAAFAGFAVSVLIAGEVLSHPARRPIGAAPVDLRAESVVVRTVTGQPVSGWLVRGTPGSGAVLLLHGVRADRREMLGRARFLHQQGYSVLLVDLPAHGESPGAHITYGIDEAQGVSAALAYLAHTLPAENIGVIGVSLGAASLVLSRPASGLSAVVLESMFPTIEEAIDDRLNMYLGPVGHAFTPLLLWQLPLRLGITPEQLRPLDAIADLHAPVLIAAGAADRHTPSAETRRIFAAANEPKQLWFVDGAAHVDLHGFAPQAYEATIGAFLASHLRGNR